MLPPELSLRSPLPSPLAMNNSPPEGPMRFAKMLFLVNASCAEASARAASSRKDAVAVIPNFAMENLPSVALGDRSRLIVQFAALVSWNSNHVVWPEDKL